jgi:hypothetical protein
MPNNSQVDWNALMQQLAAASQNTGGYNQTVNPAWNNYTQQTPSTAYPTTGSGGGFGVTGVSPSPVGPMLNVGSTGSNSGNQTLLQNAQGAPPTSIGSYYGTPVFDQASGQIVSQHAGRANPAATAARDFMPGIGGMIASLFGSPKPKWDPYIQDGQYYFANPKSQNPVPVATVPGASLKPSKTATQASDNTQSLVNLLPYIQNAIAGQAIPQQQAQLAAAQATSGPYADLMTRLYASYGPALNSIGNSINLQNQQAGAYNQERVLREQGGGLTDAGLGLMRQANPEYFNSRAMAGLGTDNLVAHSLNNLGGDLSGSEYRAIQQGLAREGTQRGTINAPSMTATVANAQRYGQAGYQRDIQSQNQLSQAIGASTAFMPQSQLQGFNPVAQVTGSNLSNPGAGQFTGVNNAGQNAYSTLSGMQSGLSSNINSLQQQNNQIDQQNKLQNSWQNILGTVSGAIGSIGGAVGGILGGK